MIANFPTNAQPSTTHRRCYEGSINRDLHIEGSLLESDTTVVNRECSVVGCCCDGLLHSGHLLYGRAMKKGAVVVSLICGRSVYARKNVLSLNADMQRV